MKTNIFKKLKFVFSSLGARFGKNEQNEFVIAALIEKRLAKKITVSIFISLLWALFCFKVLVIVFDYDISFRFIFIGVFFSVLIPSFVLTLCFIKSIDDIRKVLKKIVSRNLEFIDIKEVKLDRELFNLYTAFQKLYLKVNQNEFLQLKNDLSQQVAHDIRSPLAALTVATQDLKEVPEDRRILIRSALERIQDITNDLNSKKSKSEIDCVSHSEDLKIELIPSHIESLVSEKRMQFRSKSNVSIYSDFEDGTHGLFTKLQPKEFKRALSNLINNAIEAFEDGGEVVVSVSLHNDQIHIAVKDNGKGIPQDILNKLGERGATFGKEHLEKSGSGLGLHHTKESLKKWGGDLKIESTVGVGTTVTMILPKAPAPAWFAESIKITPNMKIVVFDDDVSIHQVWQARFDEKKIPRERVHHFNTPKALIEWHAKEQPSGEILYLSDQEFLGSSKTGTQTIRELGIGSQSILVTSRFEDDDVREACAEMKVKLLPKNLAGYVPILRSMEQENNKVVQTPDELVKNSEKQTSKRSRIPSTIGEGLGASRDFCHPRVGGDLQNGEQNEEKLLDSHPKFITKNGNDIVEKQTSKRSRIPSTNGERLGASLCDQSALGGSEKQTSPREKLESNGSVKNLISLPHLSPPLTKGRKATDKPQVTSPQSHQKSSAFLILIDDDLLMHATWKAKATISNKQIATFADPQEFLAQQNEFSKDTPIYIDSNLKNGVKGEEISKEIYKLGFKEIYLATGDDASDFGAMPHIKSVVGKQPPF